jgi:hypothetical protein
MRVDLLRRRVHWWHARARLHRSRGRHVTAVQASHRALALLESTPNSSLTAMRVQVFLTLAGVHEDLVELETAEAVLSQAYSALSGGWGR